MRNFVILSTNECAMSHLKSPQKNIILFYGDDLITYGTYIIGLIGFVIEYITYFRYQPDETFLARSANLPEGLYIFTE